MNTSINTRITGWVLLLLVPMLTSALLSQWFVASHSNDTAIAELSQFNERHQSAINASINAWQEHATDLAGSDELVNLMTLFSQYRLRQLQSPIVESGLTDLPAINLAEARPFQRYIERLNNQRRTIEGGTQAIELIGSDGVTLGKTANAEWKPSDPSVVFKAMKQKTLSLDQLFKSSNSQWHLPVIAPVWNKQGRLLGALITEYVVDEAFTAINSIEAENGNLHVAVLAPAQGTALVLSQTRSGFQVSPELIAAVAKPSSEITSVETDSATYLQSQTPIGVSDWALATRLDTNLQSGLTSRLMTVLIIALLLSIAAFAAGWWWVIRGFNQRLKAIADASERMVKRDYKIRIDDRTPDSTGAIARHLDQIAGELNENITVKVAVKQRIQQLADEDELTGLYNSDYIPDAVQQVVDGHTALPVTMGCVKVHDYARLEKTHGDALANEILVAVANRLRTAVDQRHMLARREGEFIILAGDTDEQAAALLSTRINNIFTTSFETSVGEMLISCQVGVATANDRESLAQAMRDADSGVSNDAANEPENQPASATSESDGEQTASSEKLIENAIREHRISVEYQPILRLSSGGMPVLEAAEALTRVQDEQGEVIPPNVLMPQIQNTPSVLVLDRFMLTQAIATVNQWVQDKRVTENFSLSINLSRQTVQSSDIVGFLRNSIIADGLPPERIILEISGGTEGINTDILADLRELGFTLALDDMGLQSANIDQLKDIKPAYAKFDQRRLQGVENPENDASIQQKLGDMCTGLGIEIIAKSVESADQIAELTSKGITLLQGYLFDQPKVGDKFIERWGVKPGAADELRKAS